MERFKKTLLQLYFWLLKPETIKKATTAFIFCFIFCTAVSIYFNIRIPLNQSFAYFLGEKKDFSINFLYLSDIFSLLALSVLLLHVSKFRAVSKTHLPSFLPTLIIILSIFSYFSNFIKLTIPTISIFYLLYVAKGIVLHETVKQSRTSIKNFILRVIWIFGLFEAFVSIIQFSFQSPIGMRLLGEPTFGPYLWQIAKVEALGQIFARPYGTFSHPNILSAFLVLTLIIGFYYYYSQAAQTKKAWAHLILVQITFIALFISFSRAAWLAAALTAGFFHVFTWNILKSQKRVQLIRIFFVSTALGCLLLAIYQPFVRQRGNVFDKAYQERISYNRAAVSMISQNPIFGLGPGESVLHMEQFLTPNSKPWEVQPIHNYYLLLAAEIGLPAALLFLLYLGLTLKRLVFHQDKLTDKNTLTHALLFSGLAGCAILMFFDHYFYTIQASTLLFWIWLGLSASTTEHSANKTRTT